MPRGGRRPGTGGARPGAGRPRKRPKPDAAASPPTATESAPQPPPAPAVRVQPLEYMLAVMNDPDAHPELRARMAIAAAPFVHKKMGEGGKKEDKNEAAKKVASRFGASAPPRLPGSTPH